MIALPLRTILLVLLCVLVALEGVALLRVQRRARALLLACRQAELYETLDLKRDGEALLLLAAGRSGVLEGLASERARLDSWLTDYARQRGIQEGDAALLRGILAKNCAEVANLRLQQEVGSLSEPEIQMQREVLRRRLVLAAGVILGEEAGEAFTAAVERQRADGEGAPAPP